MGKRSINALLAGAILSGAILIFSSVLMSGSLGLFGPVGLSGPVGMPSVAGSFFPIQDLTQSHSAFPVNIVAGPAPQPVMADGRVRLLYELHITNFAVGPIELIGLDVAGDDGDEALASYRGEALEKLLFTVGPPDGTNKKRTVGGGRTALIFLDLSLGAGARAPAELRHRLILSIQRKNGALLENTVNGPVVAVNPQPAPVLRPPVSGQAWIAFNALFNDDHRRALMSVDGRARIAQRFAIDWVRLGPDGRLFRDDPKSNPSFYSYGEKVLAVADGRISGLKDGLPEHAGLNEQSTREVTLDNIAGNYVVLDLGQGRFALYAHLQPGSLQVKLGDTVKSGQVLARVGNSGNSDAPHLHFHLIDGNSPLGAEGTPYELETFTQLGVLDGPDAVDNGQAWRPKPQEKPVVHRREFPVDNAVVAFP
jgi:hypothetical protein